MEIKENLWDDVAVLALSGKLMGGSDSLALHEKIRSLISDGVKHVVMDLGNMEWMNSSGLGTLMACLTTLRNADGELKLAEVTKKIEQLLSNTKLICVFETYPTVDKAVSSFLT